MVVKYWEPSCETFYIESAEPVPTTAISTTSSSTSKKINLITLAPSWQCKGCENIILPPLISNHIAVVKTKNDFIFDIEIKIYPDSSGIIDKNWNWFLVEFYPDRLYQSILHFFYNNDNQDSLLIYEGFNLTTQETEDRLGGYFSQFGLNKRWLEVKREDIIYKNKSENLCKSVQDLHLSKFSESMYPGCKDHVFFFSEKIGNDFGGE